MESTSHDNIVTMVDILEEEKDLRDASDAVLSGSDEKKCTYFQGYVKRQALYSCLTCVPDAKKDPKFALALCLACCLSCHESHDLVELYTKRNIRCDCGVKTGSSACQIEPTKKIIGDQPNERNKYNQNFAGTYCTCHRPYPDPEDPIEDEMIQCIVCEDWYHSRHLEGSKVPDSTLYSEMICGTCMKDKKFLYDYAGNAVQVVDEEASRNESTLNVTSLDESAVAASQGEEEEEEGNSAKKIKLSDDACIRPKASNLQDESAGKSMFWRDGWRKSLCQCIKCTNMYDEQRVSFLLDLEDTTHSYEEKGKEKGPKSSMYEDQLAALATLPRVNQIDAISSYTRMKEKLFEFLQTFVVNNQIVTEDDVKRFFQNMKDSESNQQVPQQPHFCR